MRLIPNMIVAPSILAANGLMVGQEVLDVEEKGADWHHIDVMDGHFVPNLSFGPELIRCIKEISQIPLDVHLMLSNPDQVIDQYIDAGCDLLTFHIEATPHADRLIEHIQKRGCKAGVALNPGTSLQLLDSVLDVSDLFLVMSVNPGFGGQTFISRSIDKVRTLKNRLDERGRGSSCLLSVDGGVNECNAVQLRQSGADVLVCGSSIYGSEDRQQTIKNLRGAH